MEIEQSAQEREPAGADAQTSVNGRASNEDKAEGAAGDNYGHKVRKERQPKRGKRRSDRTESSVGFGAHLDDAAAREDSAFSAPMFAQLSLRQKLAVVCRRISYVQKRGHNERNNYNYVTTADIAGAVGDILAELGVVVVPRLESISHEPARTGRSEVEHVARVVMAYTFMDVNTAEEITVKVAGEDLDAGDKAPYKAMTGAPTASGTLGSKKGHYSVGNLKTGSAAARPCAPREGTDKGELRRPPSRGRIPSPAEDNPTNASWAGDGR